MWKEQPLTVIKDAVNKSDDGTYPPRILGLNLNSVIPSSFALWIDNIYSETIFEDELQIKRSFGETWVIPLKKEKGEILLNGQPLVMRAMLKDGDFIRWKRDICLIYEEDPAASRNHFLKNLKQALEKPVVDNHIISQVEIDNQSISLNAGVHSIKWKDIQSIHLIQDIHSNKFIIEIHDYHTQKLPSELKPLNVKQLVYLIQWIRIQTPFHLTWIRLGIFPIDWIPDAYYYAANQKIIIPADGQENLLPDDIHFILGLQTKNERKWNHFVRWAIPLVWSLFIAFVIATSKGLNGEHIPTFSTIFFRTILIFLLIVLFFYLVGKAFKLQQKYSLKRWENKRDKAIFDAENS